MLVVALALRVMLATRALKVMQELPEIMGPLVQAERVVMPQMVGTAVIAVSPVNPILQHRAMLEILPVLMVVVLVMLEFLMLPEKHPVMVAQVEAERIPVIPVIPAMLAQMERQVMLAQTVMLVQALPPEAQEAPEMQAVLEQTATPVIPAQMAMPEPEQPLEALVAPVIREVPALTVMLALLALPVTLQRSQIFITLLAEQAERLETQGLLETPAIPDL